MSSCLHHTKTAPAKAYWPLISLRITTERAATCKQAPKSALSTARWLNNLAADRRRDPLPINTWHSQRINPRAATPNLGRSKRSDSAAA